MPQEVGLTFLVLVLLGRLEDTFHAYHDSIPFVEEKRVDLLLGTLMRHYTRHGRGKAKARAYNRT